MRVLVCGGREFDDQKLMHGLLDKLKPIIDCVIHGNAWGADSLASQWAASRGVEQEAYPADWRSHGMAAGPIRNRQMLVEGKPDIVFAFPGGRGTDNMIQQALASHVLTLRIGPPASSAQAPEVE